MSTVLIIPGLNGSDRDHWQTRWQQQIPGAVRVEQNQWHQPDLDEWADRIVETAQHHESLWLVAHSFGVLATVHALPGLARQTIGVFLVAPADPFKFGVQQRMPRHPLRVAGAIVASHSDPWLSWIQAGQLATDWSLPLLDAGDAGHINTASGHGPWEQGLQWFNSLYHALPPLKKTSRQPA